jgi:biopolymer transport protein ExbD
MGANSGSGKRRLMTDINVTPFVDIMLVLLIIFMIAAPSLNRAGMKLNLPKAGSAERIKPASMSIAIQRSGDVFIDRHSVPRDEIRKLVQEALKKNPSTDVVIAADQNVPHGEVIKVMDEIKSGGINNISLLVDAQATK